MAGAISIALGVTRLQWWSDPGSRPMTLAAFVITPSTLLRIPSIGDLHVDPLVHDLLGLNNAAQLLSDISTVALALALLLHVAVAEDRTDLALPIVFSCAFVAAVLIVCYFSCSLARNHPAESLHGRWDSTPLSIYSIMTGTLLLVVGVFLVRAGVITRSATNLQRVVVTCYILAGGIGAALSVQVIALGMVAGRTSAPKIMELGIILSVTATCFLLMALTSTVALRIRDSKTHSDASPIV